MDHAKAIIGLAAAAILSGCAASPHAPPNVTGTNSGISNSGNLKPYTVRGQTYYPAIPKPGYVETGLASWYGPESGSGKTADGERFDPDGLSAAHKTFPLPSLAEVTNLDNGKTIRVRVNDRGPFSSGRIIDLSRGAAHALGMSGTGKVRVKWLGPAGNSAPATATVNPPADTPGYIVQLGAFSDKTNAELARAQMNDARIDSRNGLYIVYLGPYDGAAAAETHRQAAIDAGFGEAILRRAP